jgi:hypothetical protein
MENIKFIAAAISGISMTIAGVLAYYAIKQFIIDKHSDSFKALAMGSIACSLISIILLYWIKILF